MRKVFKKRGCTDDGKKSWSPYPGYQACNYSSYNHIDDGSCEYESCLGCTDRYCDEEYEPYHTIPLQNFSGYNHCEPCSHLNIPTNVNYPPVKINKFASLEGNSEFRYKRGNILYRKPFNEHTFGYVTKTQIRSFINDLINDVVNKFTDYDFWLYGEVVDRIPARDVKIILTADNTKRSSLLENLMLKSIALGRKHGIVVDIRYHYKSNNFFYSKINDSKLKIKTLVPYDKISYNDTIFENNNGKMISTNLWEVDVTLPNKNKVNYYKRKNFKDNGVVNLRDKHLNEYLDNYVIDVVGMELTLKSIEFIKFTSPLN